MSNISKHVGSRIRLYRKVRHITLDEFAALLGKSKSTLSKYETGTITIDIETLFKIASVLEISINQLIDYHEPHVNQHVSPMINSFFSANRLLYVYYLNAEIKTPTCCVLEINRKLGNEYSATFYTQLKDLKRNHKYQHLYYGSVNYSSAYTTFFLSNQVNELAKIFLIATNPLYRGETTYGILTGISSWVMKPVSYKVLLSRHAQPEDDALMQKLILTKDELKKFKNLNAFVPNEILDFG